MSSQFFWALAPTFQPEAEPAKWMSDMAGMCCMGRSSRRVLSGKFSVSIICRSTPDPGPYAKGGRSSLAMETALAPHIDHRPPSRSICKCRQKSPALHIKSVPSNAGNQAAIHPKTRTARSPGGSRRAALVVRSAGRSGRCIECGGTGGTSPRSASARRCLVHAAYR